MKIKITFHNMQHSKAMEQHALAKLKKVEELLKGEEWETPKYLELWLKANPQHPHHATELILKTPQFNLNAHDENTDMYVAIDTTVDKMFTQLSKEKKKLQDKKQKVETPKNEFNDDKYNL